MHRLGEAGAHHPGGGHSAIEPRQRNHVHDGLHALARPADHPTDGRVELHFRGGVGAVAELVLKALEEEAVAAAFFRQPGHEEAGQALIDLRQNEESVRHGRGHEPFMAGDPPFSADGRFGAGGVGAHVGAALLLGHAHAERNAVLGESRLLREIIFARQHRRRPLLVDIRRSHERGERGAGHGQRAEVPGFELRHEIEAGRARLMAASVLQRILFPYGAMQPLRDGTAHQRMIGRMIFHHVDAPALPVMRAQLRQFRIGEARHILRFRRQHESARLFQFAVQFLREPGGDLHHERVAEIGVAAGERRRLVGDFVRFQGLVPSCSIQMHSKPVVRDLLKFSLVPLNFPSERHRFFFGNRARPL